MQHVFIVALLVACVGADTIYYNNDSNCGSGGCNFNLPATWVGDKIPGENDSVVINVTSTDGATIFIDGAQVTVLSITTIGNLGFYLRNGAYLNASQSNGLAGFIEMAHPSLLEIDSGSSVFTATLNVSDNVDLTSGSLLSVENLYVGSLSVQGSSLFYSEVSSVDTLTFSGSVQFKYFPIFNKKASILSNPNFTLVDNTARAALVLMDRTEMEIIDSVAYIQTVLFGANTTLTLTANNPSVGGSYHIHNLDEGSQPATVTLNDNVNFTLDSGDAILTTWENVKFYTDSAAILKLWQMGQTAASFTSTSSLQILDAPIPINATIQASQSVSLGSLFPIGTVDFVSGSSVRAPLISISGNVFFPGSLNAAQVVLNGGNSNFTDGINAVNMSVLGPTVLTAPIVLTTNSLFWDVLTLNGKYSQWEGKVNIVVNGTYTPIYSYPSVFVQASGIQVVNASLVVFLGLDITSPPHQLVLFNSTTPLNVSFWSVTDESYYMKDYNVSFGSNSTTSYLTYMKTGTSYLPNPPSIGFLDKYRWELIGGGAGVLLVIIIIIVVVITKRKQSGYSRIQ